MLTVSTAICRGPNYKYCLGGAGILGIFLVNEQQLPVNLSKVDRSSCPSQTVQKSNVVCFAINAHAAMASIACYQCTCVRKVSAVVNLSTSCICCSDPWPPLAGCPAAAEPAVVCLCTGDQGDDEVGV